MYCIKKHCSLYLQCQKLDNRLCRGATLNRLLVNGRRVWVLSVGGLRRCLHFFYYYFYCCLCKKTLPLSLRRLLNFGNISALPLWFIFYMQNSKIMKSSLVKLAMLYFLFSFLFRSCEDPPDSFGSKDFPIDIPDTVITILVDSSYLDSILIIN